MGKNYSVSHANPRAGKSAMLLGNLEKIIGVGLFSLGVWNFLSSNDIQTKESSKVLMQIGGANVGAGYIIYWIGRLQHWYSNTTY